MKVVAGLVVAAGMSSRMNAFKPLLTLGEKTLIEHVVDNLRAGGVQEIVMVTGNRAEELEKQLSNRNIHFIRNEFYKTTSMYYSAKLGLEYLENRCDQFFFLPGDIPLFKPRSLIDMQKAMDESKCMLIHPMFAGKHGHPVLFSSACISGFLTYEGTNGLKGAMQSFTEGKIDLAVPDKGILMDADTQGDFEKLSDYFLKMNMPSADECIEILKYYKTEQLTIEHCIAVAEVAEELVQKLLTKGYRMNLSLVKAGALLHDVARREKEHANCGAEWIGKLGYAEVSEVIKTHMDLPEEFIDNLDERAVVYLADKLVIGNKKVSLEERFKIALNRFGENDQVINSIRSRLDNAKRVLSKIEHI